MKTQCILFLIIFLSINIAYSISLSQIKNENNNIEVTIKQTSKYEVEVNSPKPKTTNCHKENKENIDPKHIEISKPITEIQANNFNSNSNSIIKERFIKKPNERIIKKGDIVIKEEFVELINPLKINMQNHYPSLFRTYSNLYNNFNDNDISTVCSDIGCQNCSLSNAKFCKICKHGYFNYNNQCYSVCPQNFVANVFKRTCESLNINNALKQYTFLKAFSVGSCKNICGGASTDCSCKASCLSEGNCCSDYYICEDLINKNVRKQNECNVLNPKCDLCEDFISPKCGKCKQGLFNRNGECLQSCFPDDLVNSQNKLCIPKQECSVQNCKDCNKGVCRTCENGYYMYNNQCLHACPEKLRADRISWTCLEPPVFAWYWIFPSKASCRDRCDRVTDKIEMDCSCHESCFRHGNCCQDVEDYCPQFVYWK